MKNGVGENVRDLEHDSVESVLSTLLQDAAGDSFQ